MKMNTGKLGVFSVVLAVAISIVGAGLLVAEPQGCDRTKSEQTDLSGTYTGRITYPDGNLMGNATLTITGNQFTLEGEGTTHTGRISAVTTCNYTGATLTFGESTPTQMAPAVSVRARKTGDRLSLTSVPGEKRSFSFTSGRPPRTRSQPAEMPTNMN
jgi:hypothetical protein